MFASEAWKNSTPLQSLKKKPSPANIKQSLPNWECSYSFVSYMIVSQEANMHIAFDRDDKAYSKHYLLFQTKLFAILNC